MVLVGRPLLDLQDPATVASALNHTKPHLIINAAAYTAVDQAESEFDLAMAINRDGARAVAASATELSVPIIHLSTDYVFSGERGEPMLESDETGPQTAYGASKLAGEIAVAEAAEQHLIFRTAWVHSPFGHNFTKTMLRLAGERERLGVVNDQFGSPTYAVHLAAALLTIATRIETGQSVAWGTYHLTNRGLCTWYEFAGEIFSASRKLSGPSAIVDPVSTADYPTPARRPANSVLDCTKAEEHLQVTLPNWRDGVRDCVGRLLEPF